MFNRISTESFFIYIYIYNIYNDHVYLCGGTYSCVVVSYRATDYTGTLARSNHLLYFQSRLAIIMPFYGNPSAVGHNLLDCFQLEGSLYKVDIINYL